MEFKLILVDKQPDEIIRILSSNLMQVLHIYLLSLILQKLVTAADFKM